MTRPDRFSTAIDTPTWSTWALSPPRDRPFSSHRNYNHQQHQQQQQSLPSSSFHVRINDHASHQFSPPASPPRQQPGETNYALKPSEEPFTPSPKPRRVPLATPAILVATVVLFILMMHSNNCPRHGTGTSSAASGCVGGEWLKSLSFQPWKENPLLGPRRERLLKWGGLESRRAVDAKEGWRLVSAVALNGGLLQLLVNLAVTLALGLRLEFVFGWAKVAVVYVVSGFGGSVLSVLFVKDQVFAGASGAVMGLIGATAADTATNWHVTANKPLLILSLLLFALISVAFGLTPQADNFANVGGFLMGLLLGLALFLRPQRGYRDTRHLSPREAYILKNLVKTGAPPVETMYRKSQRVVQAVAGLVSVGLLVAGCLVLFVGGDVTRGRCRWCRYMACVPHLKWTCPGPYN